MGGCSQLCSAVCLLVTLSSASAVPLEVNGPVFLVQHGVQTPSLGTSELGTICDQQNTTAQAVDNLRTMLIDVNTRLEQTSTLVTTGLKDLRSQLSAVEPRDCSDLPKGSPSGVYRIHPGLRHPVPAYCDQDTDGGGWTVIQRRADIQPREDFNRGWDDYKWGFGALNAEFWWGLENIWLMTTPLDRQHELRIDMADFDNSTRYAVYKKFRLSSESDGYRLNVTSFSGDAGDSFTYHIGSKFSTKDRDQDSNANTNCAARFNGGWWYDSCLHSHLNGLYLSGVHPTTSQGVVWRHWRGGNYSHKDAEMKIRPIH